MKLTSFIFANYGLLNANKEVDGLVTMLMKSNSQIFTSLRSNVSFLKNDYRNPMRALGRFGNNGLFLANKSVHQFGEGV